MTINVLAGFVYQPCSLVLGLNCFMLRDNFDFGDVQLGALSLLWTKLHPETFRVLWFQNVRSGTIDAETGGFLRAGNVGPLESSREFDPLTVGSGDF